MAECHCEIRKSTQNEEIFRVKAPNAMNTPEINAKDLSDVSSLAKIMATKSAKKSKKEPFSKFLNANIFIQRIT